MLLAGIPANGIHSLRKLSHAYYAFFNLDGTCTRDPNMNLIIQYGQLGLVLGLGLGLGFILYCRIWRPLALPYMCPQPLSVAMDFFLAGDGATRRGEGCSGLERPLARFELERTREQKKPFLAKRASWCRHS